jgi:hypothetical protein
MTTGKHPELDELIEHCMGSTHAANDSVRLHLNECAECRAQAARLCGDLALAAMSVPRVTPPAEAKTRLFQAAGLDPKYAAAPTTSAAVSPAGRGVKANSTVVPLKTHRPSPLLIWGGWIAAAACLFYAVHVHDDNEVLNRQLRSTTSAMVQSTNSAARAQQVMDLLKNPKAQRVTLVAAHATVEPTGHAVYLSDRGALVFTASNLAPLPPNKIYELWVIPANGSAPVPAGTFAPDARGAANVVLPEIPKGIAAKAFGVTMENAGGSTTPTMPILLAGG